MLAMLVVVLLVLGLLLLALEVFVIPGFGAAGILGVVCTAAAVGVAWWKLGPLEAVGALAVGATAGGALVWYVPRTRAAKEMVLHEVQTVRAADPGLLALVGALGETRTPLRPAGSVEIAGRLVDVVSDGAFVEAGIRVQVVRVEGVRVVVEPVKEFGGA